MFYGLFLLSIWLFCIAKGFINKPFSYIKHHCDSDIAKGLFLSFIWLFCIGKISINKSFFYAKHHRDSDITKRYHYNERDNEEGHACG
jgi:hypothetical protein